MTIATLVIAIIILAIVFIKDLYDGYEIRPLPGTLAIMGWLLVITFFIAYALSHINWAYKIF